MSFSYVCNAFSQSPSTEKPQDQPYQMYREVADECGEEFLNKCNEDSNATFTLVSPPDAFTNKD